MQKLRLHSNQAVCDELARADCDTIKDINEDPAHSTILNFTIKKSCQFIFDKWWPCMY